MSSERTHTHPTRNAAFSPADLVALLVTSLGFGVIQLDVSVVNVAIQPIGASLGGQVSGLQWVVSAYTVAFAALIISAGAAGDRLGARRIFMAGFVVLTSASALCGLSPDLAVLIGARAVQGIGAALLAPTSLALLSHRFPEPDRRARAVGLWAAGGSIALAGGPLLGGVLTSALGWRAIFFINVPIGLGTITLAAATLAETPRRSERSFDAPGQLTSVIALAALAGATIEGGRVGFASPWVLLGYVAAVMAAGAFVAVERRSRRPMLELALFRRPAFSVSAGIGLVVNVAFYGLIFVLSLFFQRTLGFSALGAGLAFAPTTLAILVANLGSARLSARVGATRVIAAGGLLMSLGCAGLLVAGQHSGYEQIVVQMILLGVGLGLIVPSITGAMLDSVEAGRSGAAAGTLNSARQSGSVIGVAVFGALVGDGSRIVSGLHVALYVCLALCAAVAGSALWPGSLRLRW